MLYPVGQCSVAIEMRDAYAIKVHYKLSRKRQAKERFSTRAEWHHMERCDKESKFQHSLDMLQDELRSLREAKLGHRLPTPAFKPGQCVMQWWASWLVSAVALPKYYHTKQRPAWYVGEVLSYAGFLHRRYAGQVVEENFYNVY